MYMATRQGALVSLALMLGAIVCADPAGAQNPVTAEDLQTILRRVERQEAELHALRAQLGQQGGQSSQFGIVETGHPHLGQPQPLIQPQLGPTEPGPTPLPPVESDSPGSPFRTASMAPLEEPDETYSDLDYRDKTTQYDDVLKRLKALEERGGDDAKKKDDGWIDLSSEKWTVKMGGHVQADYIMWPRKDPAITSPLARNYFEFRRLRLTADGVGYGVYDFRLQMTVEPENIGADPNIVYLPTIKDAYFTINELPILGRLRFGNFFVPFSLEQVTNDTNNIFLERSIPAQGTFTGGREVGFASYNFSESKDFSWTTGFFFDNISDTGIDRTDSNQGYRISGRVVYLPYYDEPSNGRYLVHTGAGILYTHDQDQRARFRARPDIHTGPFLIDTFTMRAEHFTIGNIELATVMGPFSIQSEMFLCGVDTIDDGNQPLYGAYLYGSWFLTGENRKYERVGQHGAQFGRNEPFNNVYWVPGCCSWGAWEFKMRWSMLDFNSVDRGRYNDVTVGFNWYFSDRARMMFDYIHPVTTDETVFGATHSDIIGMRFDWNW